MTKKLLVATICLGLSQVSLAARITRLWSFSELQSAADAVVVATPVSTRETGRRTELADLQPPVPVIELNTEFKVLSVLSGQLASGTFVLRHFKLDDSRLVGGCLNCGGGIEFSASASSTRLCRSGDVSPDLPSPCDYLMYLKRSAATVYEPVSGHVVPGMSILLLSKAR